MKKISKFTREDRKYIGGVIANLEDKAVYTGIFDILIKDPADDIICMTNSNDAPGEDGNIYFNLSAVSDATLFQVTTYLDKHVKKKSVVVDSPMDVIPNAHASKSDRAYKLSNYEQNIIKQRDLKKINYLEYDEINLPKKRQSRTSKKVHAP